MRKESVKKAVTIITAISSAVTVLVALLHFLLPAYLLHQYRIDAKGASSIGIIGSADGPTTIYVSGQSSVWQIAAVSGLIAIAGIAYLILPRFTKQ